MSNARSTCIGLILVATLCVAKFGVPELPSWGEEQQGYMSSNNPWAKDYVAKPNQPQVFYRNCAAARAAGLASISRGEPGYRPPLDRDGDGVACEPWR